jgi:hypothetical protein
MLPNRHNHVESANDSTAVTALARIGCETFAAAHIDMLYRLTGDTIAQMLLQQSGLDVGVVRSLRLTSWVVKGSSRC